MLRTFTFVGLAVYASAQSISASCSSALGAIATNPDSAACLSPSSLIPLAAGSANSSIIPPINNWLTTICAAAPCSNDTLAAVVQNITSGCSAELSVTGINSDTVPAVVTAVQQYYPVVRKIACLKDGNTNCVSQTLTNIEGALGTPLSINNIISMVSNPPANLLQNKTLTCTNCIKAAYGILSTDVPSIVSDVAPALQSQCGTAFTDGATPSGILQSAAQSSAAGGQSNAATLNFDVFMSRGALAGVGASGLVVLSTIFAML